MAVEEGLGLYLLWQIIQSAQFCSKTSSLFKIEIVSVGL